MARSVLTFVQESQGISNREAMENSCTGYAEQYITDVLHDSEYIPEVALKTLLTKELPRKLVSKWTPQDTELFIKGISKHGKDFTSIQKELLPQKDMKDIVDFYYAWKWSEPAKEFRSCRRRRRSNSKRRFPSIGCIFGELSSPKIVTRSVAAASRLSLEKSGQILGVANPTESSNVVAKRRRNGSLVVR
ncbi:Arginine-glutamic acid dipeptide repeats protein [Habropoda laboriosa]|uniref:Arginine-glutamic acid dipeptide repeats protein n=2 Tax=Habropoda laboriosa TaxID=597456 RepID=A0A0L7QSH0_9HYME|nr:Arginine-glutamic acid dipeptide repeats protein [Habropoda laboriosa]